MTISTETIKELRDKTGVSVMQCKKALEESGGNIEKALVILKQKSKDIASKKADRTFGAGVIQAYVHSSGTIGAMVELVCETDFVSKNEEFKTLARDIAMHITASAPEYLKIEEVPEEDMARAKELFEKDVDSKKPKEIRDKILEGKLSTYFGEKVLLDQSFIKNPEVTIRALIEQAVQKFGERTEIGRFVRFSIS